MIASGFFCSQDPSLFKPIVDSLLNNGDYYMLLADYGPYIREQEKVGRLFLDRDEWTRISILNVSHMGRFSSDRSVLQYAGKIWNVKPVKMKKKSGAK
jgi:starch phosphorylase